MLPLTFNPLHKVTPNKGKALRICNQQMNNFNQNPQDKEDSMESEVKLKSLGHVEFFGNLTPEQQEMLASNPFQNFNPWKAVSNGNSIITPCRLLFDAS